jgi:hypothetical protein
MSKTQSKKSPKSKSNQESRKKSTKGIAKQTLAKNSQSRLKNMKFPV